MKVSIRNPQTVSKQTVHLNLKKANKQQRIENKK